MRQANPAQTCKVRHPRGRLESAALDRECGSAQKYSAGPPIDQSNTMCNDVNANETVPKPDRGYRTGTE